MEKITNLVKEITTGTELPVVITHANCMDGTGTVLAVARTFGVKPSELTVHYCQYGQNFKSVIDSCEDRNVIMGDFSFKKAELLLLNDLSNNLIVIDHHKTAEEDLKNLDFAVFDMNLSGATLTWKILNDGKEAPILLKYIQDRDIWQWKLENSKEISAGLRLLDSRKPDELMRYMDDVSDLLVPGKTVLAYEVDYVNRKAFSVNRDNKIGNSFIKIGNIMAPIINTTTLISEVGNNLSIKHPFAVMYFITDDSLVLSFRSNEGSDNWVDVAEIARSFGGGGHKHAAGCSFKFQDINLNTFFRTYDLDLAVKQSLWTRFLNYIKANSWI